jgi:arylsulfatase A-like enzyme
VTETTSTRSLLRRIAVKAALAAPVHGAVLALLVFLFEVRAASDLSAMGVRDDAARDYALKTFFGFIVRDQLRLLLLYVGLGALLGGIAAALGRIWDYGGRHVPRGALRVGRGVSLIVLLHLYFFARGVILYPQLYAEGFYDQGGLGRAFQVLLTHHVPLWLLDSAFVLGVGAAVGVPLWRRSRAWGLPARLRALAERLLPRLRDRRVWLAGGITASLFAVMGVVAALPGKAPAKGPNVLIVAVDSLRGDHVGPDHAQVAPTLAGLARRGTHFRQAFVTLPRTFPSWVTQLTGRYPNHHGIRTMFPTWDERSRVKGALPALLRQHGYRTAVVSDFAGEIFTRIDLGFDTVRAPVFRFRDILAQRGLQIHRNVMPYLANRYGHRYVPAMAGLAENADPEMLTDTAVETLRQVSRGERFFMTVFYSAAHFPYASRDPYYRRFADPKYRGPFLYQKPVAVTPAEYSAADLRQIAALYDGSVAAADHAITRLLAELKRLGLDENTIVVVTADHGENLLEEHRGMGHGEHLRGDRAVNVPLVIYDPVHRPPPHAVDAITRDVDLAPTLAKLLGVPPPPQADGVDLGPLLRGEQADLGLRAYHETGIWMLSSGPYFGPGERIPYPPITSASELDAAHDDDIVLKREYHDIVDVAKHRAIRTPEWKLLYIPLRDGVRYQLFDLKHDPEQLVDVAAQHPDVVKELRENLLAWMLSEPGVVMRRDFVLPQ